MIRLSQSPYPLLAVPRRVACSQSANSNAAAAAAATTAPRVTAAAPEELIVVVVVGAVETATPLMVTPVTPADARLVLSALVNELPRPVILVLTEPAESCDVTSTEKATFAPAACRRRRPEGASVMLTMVNLEASTDSEVASVLTSAVFAVADCRLAAVAPARLIAAETVMVEVAVVYEFGTTVTLVTVAPAKRSAKWMPLPKSEKSDTGLPKSASALAAPHVVVSSSQPMLLAVDEEYTQPTASS